MNSKFSLKQWANWLQVNYSGQDINFCGVSIDSRTIKPGELFVALKGEQFDGHDFIEQAKSNGAVAALVSKPIEGLPYLQVADTRLAFGQVAAAWCRELNVAIAAITGSNGKTTVKEMLATILREQYAVHWSQGNFNNDYGLPLVLLQLNPQHQRCVLEMGANHPGEIAYLTRLAPPNLALINNVAPAHTEGFGGIAGVARSKAEIYQGLTENGIALINIDDHYAECWRKLIGNKTIVTFGMSKQADVWGQVLSPGVFELSTPEGTAKIQLQLLGEHNVRNAIAAAAAAYAWQIPLTKIKAGLEKMLPVKGRLASKQGIHGNLIIDDSYNANPGSVLAAIKVLAACPGKRILVLGDMRELGELAVQYHSEVGQAAQQAGIDQLLTYGELSQHAASAFTRQARHFTDKAELIVYLKEILTPEAVALIKGSRSMKMEDVVTELVMKQEGKRTC